MSRRRAPSLACGAAVLLAALLLPPVPAAAQAVASSQGPGVELKGPVRQTLKQIEEQWLQWVVQNNPQQAKQAVDGLLETARQIGMVRLSDLSAGALARAVQAAREKDFARAHWALEAAERFDPGRPETAYAEAAVLRLEGRYPAAAGAWLRAYPRLFTHPLERLLWLQSLLTWVLAVLLLSGALFVAVQMLTKASALVRDLVDLLSRKLPRPAALALAGVLLIWPLALPAGPLWLALWWSVLLWGYGSPSERTVFVALWLLVGVAPLAVDLQRRSTAVALSPPSLALQSLAEHRLYGSLFTDLGVLRSVLPQSVAVKQLLADVHRTLNQWELARSLYRQVLEKEPDNTAAQVNLGVYAFLKGDFNAAIQTFQKAAEADPKSAAAQYDLSQAYSESYMFDEQHAALNRAQAIDAARVNAWVNQGVRVAAVPGGRIPEIRRELAAAWHGGEDRAGGSVLLRRGTSLFVSLSLIVAALALHFVRRPFGYAEGAGEVFPEGAFDRWARALLPGMASAEIGEGGRSYLAILLTTALLLLPFFGKVGVPVPWRYDPGNFASLAVASLGLLLYFGVRLQRELRQEV